MTLESVLLIIAGYLLGSVSSAYLAGKLFAGKDLREYGSGNLGGSMVWEHVGRWAVIPAGLFDVFKAALPTWLALQLGLGMTVAAAAGLAAVAGHSWSVFLRFTGGRGMLSYLGVLLVIFPWGGVWFMAITIVGYLLGGSAPWVLAGLVTMPLVAYFLGGPEVVGPMSGAIILLALAKRLEANRRPLPPPGPERRAVILRRAFLDRDLASHKEWINQRPDPGPRRERLAGKQRSKRVGFRHVL
jgi:glycerol-3-phosphate acyltransferase PlsY